MSAIQLTSISDQGGKNSLDISVDSNHSVDSSDVARELSWDVSRYGLEDSGNLELENFYVFRLEIANQASQSGHS